MSTSQHAALVAEVHKLLKASLPGFVERSQQQQMMARSLSLFRRSTVGLVEAPTGTGKSLGYLLPGLSMALLDNRPLVISTATASLQDQLAKDIPILSKAFVQCGQKPIRMVVAKGRERHVCPVRMEEATGIKDLFNGEEDAALDRVAKAFEGGQWGGLRDNLPEPLTHKQWIRINNVSATCQGKRCHLYDDCPYYLTQEAISEAHVVITNHDYLLTCLANIPSSPLAAEGTMYVFDEAHHLPKKLLSAFARRLDVDAFPGELVTSILPICAEHRRDVEESAAACIARYAETKAMLTSLLTDKSMFRFKLGKVPQEIGDVLKNLHASLETLVKHLNKAKESIRTMRNTSTKTGKRNVALEIGEMKLAQLIGDLASASICLSEYCGEDELARWVVKGSNGTQICCSPFDASAKARRHLWPITKCALLTSATLTTLGAFGPTLFELGLPGDTQTLKLTSPFDYSRATLTIPTLAVDGTDKMHTRLSKAFVAEKAIRATAHQGVLVYFTSKRQLLDCFNFLTDEEKSIVLVQGVWQPSALLEEHRLRIDKGLRSVIFGMDSMGEGVDLPGNYCTRVVIDRLPFPSLDDPVIATHAEYLTLQGQDPFHLLTLPKAGRKFAQVCGRLMRREGDSGEVIVLDRRLISKSYGSRMVRGTEFLQRTES